jgi:ribosomal protein L16 Arg81 hydroxylase
VAPAPGSSGRGGGASEQQYSLAWTIDPFPLDRFFAEYWEQKTLLVTRKQPDYYTGLLSVDEIDRVVTTLNLHHPDVSMVNARKELKAAQYTYPSGLIDVARLYQAFAEGGTIILSQLHMMVPELAIYCRAMEREFSTRFQTNIYLTPAGDQQGFKPHYDSHDVFVLQVAGRKKWQIYDTPVELPLRAQDFDPETHRPGAVTMEFDLNPGDMVYIPRGIMHAASSDDALSLHITVGIIARTWSDLLLESLSTVALNDPAFRKMLPPGFALPGYDRSAAATTYRALLEKFVASGNFERALDHFADDLATTRHPLLRGQIQQVLSLGKVAIDSIVGARPALVYRIIDKGEAFVVTCYGSDISFPSHAIEPVRFALETPRFRVADLPGDLDDEGKLVLARRLIREGILRQL